MYDINFINNPEYRKRFGDMEEITRKEADSLYKKIITEVATGLKQYGFKKSKSTSLERKNEFLVQILNFQRYTHLPTITINTAIRPLFLSTTDDFILPLCKRLHHFDSKESAWYPIKRDTKTVSGELLSILVDMVLTYFDKLDTPKKIIDNLDIIENGEYTSPSSVILPCALKDCNSEISLLYIDKEINRLNTQIAESANSSEYGCYLEYYISLKSLVEENKWLDINNLLQSYEQEFVQKKYGKRV